jgi:hypothetical protein
VGGKEFPEDGRPFEEHIADVESIQDPSPLRLAEPQVFVEASGFGIADIPCAV